MKSLPFKFKASLKKVFHVPQSKGYTLLFAVIVSVLVLSVAAFILSVSRKEFLLSSSARDSIYAFYAADSGLECAVENLSLLGLYGVSGRAIPCGSASWTMSESATVNGAATSTFYMRTGSGTSFGSGSGSQISQSGAASCAWVQVGQYYDPASNSTTTNIESRGYNIGWNPTANDCSTAGPRKVERALRLMYQ